MHGAFERHRHGNFQVVNLRFLTGERFQVKIAFRREHLQVVLCFGIGPLDANDVIDQRPDPRRRCRRLRVGRRTGQRSNAKDGSGHETNEPGDFHNSLSFPIKHRAPEKFLRPRDQVTNMTWKPKDQLEIGRALKEQYHVQTRTSCTTCHR